jgi:hypothetical protein
MLWLCESFDIQHSLSLILDTVIYVCMLSFYKSVIILAYNVVLGLAGRYGIFIRKCDKFVCYLLSFGC